MKIISGKYKGRRLKGFDIEGTRPTMDRVKESLFASINSYLEGSKVLDLFAGSGNLGIEALSNGSSFVFFCDKNKKCINVIKDNLKEIGDYNYKTYLGDFRTYLKNDINKYDIIFIDPPYKTNFIPIALEIIDKNNLINKGGIIVLELDNMDNLVFDNNKYEIIKNKKYSDKYIVILKNLL